jgi:hypothetical protein
VWIAGALLTEGNQTARKVLETVAAGKNGVMRLDAEIILTEFEKGNLIGPFTRQK